MICGMCEVGVGAMATLLQGCDGCGFPGLLPFCDGGCLTRAARAAAVLPYSCAASYGEASLPACFILRSESDYRAQLWLHPVGFCLNRAFVCGSNRLRGCVTRTAE
jgi:hypothetical protein